MKRKEIDPKPQSVDLEGDKNTEFTHSVAEPIWIALIEFSGNHLHDGGEGAGALLDGALGAFSWVGLRAKNQDDFAAQVKAELGSLGLNLISIEEARQIPDEFVEVMVGPLDEDLAERLRATDGEELTLGALYLIDNDDDEDDDED